MGIPQPVAGADPLTFAAPDGTTIAAVPVALDPDPDSYRLTIEVSADTYATIESASLFHLTPQARGRDSARFQPQKRARIELRPGRELRAELIEGGGGLDPLHASADSAALATESWFALAVTTEVTAPADFEGTLREGYRSAWAREPAGDGSPMLATIARVLADAGVVVDEPDATSVMRWTSDRETGSWRNVALADDDNGRVAVYSVVPTRAKSESFADIALVLAHLNSGLVIGNWELDVSTGDLCFKTSIDVGDEPLTRAMAERLVARNEQATSSALAVLEALAAGEITVAAALASIEQ